MLKMSLVALVVLGVVLACGCVGASTPTNIEIFTNNLGAYAENGRNSIEGVYVTLYDSSGNSVAASGTLLCTISGASVKKSGDIRLGKTVNITMVELDKSDFMHTQYDALETDSNRYVKVATKDSYAALVCKIIHHASPYDSKYNSYSINNYIPTRELGFSNKTIKYESDCIIDTSFKSPENINCIGSSSHSNLMIQVDFKPDGSDSTIRAEKLLTA